MPLRPSRILQLIRAGQFPTVLKINLSDPRVIEIAALSGVATVYTVVGDLFAELLFALSVMGVLWAWLQPREQKPPEVFTAGLTAGNGHR